MVVQRSNFGAADDREERYAKWRWVRNERPNGRSRGDERGRHGQQGRINRKAKGVRRS